LLAGVITQNVIFENMDYFIGSDISITYTWCTAFVHDYQRLKRARPEAAYFDNLSIQFFCLDMAAKALQNFSGAGGATARCRTNKEYRGFTFLELAPLSLSFGKGLSKTPSNMGLQ
jgi:hypothetical protein